MEIELHPAVSLLEETFNVLIAPPELLTAALNGHQSLQRYKILYICGNYSRILSRLDRNITELEIRRAFTSFQLMTILEENHHSFLIVEHDPMLYEDAGEMMEYIAQALKQTSREATILLYAPALDPHLQKITELADRVFCIYEKRSSGQSPEGRGEDAGSPGHAGGILMRWPWKRGAALCDPRMATDLKVIERQTARRYWRRCSVPGPAKWRR